MTGKPLKPAVEPDADAATLRRRGELRRTVGLWEAFRRGLADIETLRPAGSC